MSVESDYGLTPEQYHAGLDKLWGALENVKYSGERDVFTMCADRIKDLETALKPFANFACSDSCACNNCAARDLLNT